jgi:hypothetical protein
MIGGSLLVAGQVATAAPPLRFGAILSSNDFPDNSYTGRYCDKIVDGGSDPYNCTWIENEAKNSSTPKMTARAPKDGYINKIRLISGVGGSFKLFLARYKPAVHQGKVVKAGPTITYQTDPCNAGGSGDQCTVQVINIAPLYVHKYDMLAIRTNKTSILQCSQGGDHVSVYNPPLAVGGAFRNATDTDGCYLLLQAQYQS